MGTDQKFRVSVFQDAKLKKAGDVARHYFPGAIGSSTTLKRVAPVIKELGCCNYNTLFAQSVCPDEINHEKGDITNLFIDHLGEVFHLGGLAGIPFTGKTGFGAFSHHVPENGHCFVLMAPHIGISKSLELGHYSRLGQLDSGSACGAAIGAYNLCCAKKPIPDMSSPSEDDYQMCYIINQISKCVDEIQSKETENERQAELATQNWKIAKKMLDKVVSTNFGSDSSKLFVLTGIQINMPQGFEDFFQPLTFEQHTKDGKVVDLMNRTFVEQKVNEETASTEEPTGIESENKKPSMSGGNVSKRKTRLQRMLKKLSCVGKREEKAKEKLPVEITNETNGTEKVLWL